MYLLLIKKNNFDTAISALLNYPILLLPSFCRLAKSFSFYFTVKMSIFKYSKGFFQRLLLSFGKANAIAIKQSRILSRADYAGTF